MANKLTNASAIRLLESQEPEKPDLFDEMLGSLLRSADISQAQFEQFSLLYLMDMQYPRSDIALATSVVMREKGWHQNEPEHDPALAHGALLDD